jgi:6-pyruvoyltetrahydropterin/6-carboxytetrahydropterin synthase
VTTEVVRYHDFSYGHRVVGHEGKCANLHGHNGRVHFTVQNSNGLDKLGRVIDFVVIKSLLCQWVEDNWDHRFLFWDDDPHFIADPDGNFGSVQVPFNPTAENMARYLLEVVGPDVLSSHPSLTLTSVLFEETRKCSVRVSL